MTFGIVSVTVMIKNIVITFLSNSSRFSVVHSVFIFVFGHWIKPNIRIWPNGNNHYLVQL